MKRLETALIQIQPIDGSYFMTPYFWATTIIILAVGFIAFRISITKRKRPPWLD